MKALALTLALSLAGAPALAEDGVPADRSCSRPEAKPGEPCDAAAGYVVTWAGTLTGAEAWRTAARKRLELEAALKLADERANLCESTASSPSLVTGLLVAAGLVATGLVLGIVIAK